MSDYLKKRNGVYYYYRRVPTHMAPYEPKKFLWISLKTKDENEARKRALIHNSQNEKYWSELIRKDERSDIAAYKKAVTIARAHGFMYKSSAEIVATDTPAELVSRILAAAGKIEKKETVSSILGITDTPKLLLSECLELYWPLAADMMSGKSKYQRNRFETETKTAWKQFTDAVGDKPFANVTRSDSVIYVTSLAEKINAGIIKAATANKRMMRVKSVMDKVAPFNEIKINTEELFKKLKFKAKTKQRLPFDTEFITSVIFKTISTMNDEARYLIYALADTGARPNELVGLEKDDIILTGKIPHIIIRDNATRRLKTEDSERIIPLVGTALWAFSQIPGGFKRKNTDSTTAGINKFFKEHNILGQRQTLYSLRHSFKDRLREKQCPEGVQNRLMGHKDKGQPYGNGYKNDILYEWMQKIALPTDNLT